MMVTNSAIIKMIDSLLDVKSKVTSCIYIMVDINK